MARGGAEHLHASQARRAEEKLGAQRGKPESFGVEGMQAPANPRARPWEVEQGGRDAGEDARERGRAGTSAGEEAPRRA
jgi:hypothetical protein